MCPTPIDSEDHGGYQHLNTFDRHTDYSPNQLLAIIRLVDEDPSGTPELQASVIDL